MIIHYPDKKQIFESYCFIHNGSWFLATLKVFEGGGIEYWGRKSKEEFLKDSSSGWVTVDIPDGTELRIGEIGLIVNQAKTDLLLGCRFDHKWISQESFVKSVLDAYHVSLGNKSASEVCFEAFEAYQKNPCVIAHAKLKDAYFDVPEHERRFILGDQDNKDFPIKHILGIK